jgi:hypothetical protein
MTARDDALRADLRALADEWAVRFAAGRALADEYGTPDGVTRMIRMDRAAARLRAVLDAHETASAGETDMSTTPERLDDADREALIDEALAEIGRQDRADEACSICHASVRPDRRDRHLDWHASLLRCVERDRLPEVFGAVRAEREGQS